LGSYVALGVNESLAVLGRKEPHEAVDFLLHQIEELIY